MGALSMNDVGMVLHVEADIPIQNARAHYLYKVDSIQNSSISDASCDMPGFKDIRVPARVPG